MPLLTTNAGLSVPDGGGPAANAMLWPDSQVLLWPDTQDALWPT